MSLVQLFYTSLVCLRRIILLISIRISTEVIILNKLLTFCTWTICLWGHGELKNISEEYVDGLFGGNLMSRMNWWIGKIRPRMLL